MHIDAESNKNELDMVKSEIQRWRRVHAMMSSLYLIVRIEDKHRVVRSHWILVGIAQSIAHSREPRGGHDGWRGLQAEQ